MPRLMMYLSYTSITRPKLPRPSWKNDSALVRVFVPKQRPALNGSILNYVLHAFQSVERIYHLGPWTCLYYMCEQPRRVYALLIVVLTGR